LLAFLDDGPPPLYLGYGSMVDADAAGTIALVAALCRGAGVRAIVCRGWSATVPVPDVPGLLVIDGAPHGRLLPRCACAIHHGGAGTTHAAASAGIPQLVVPHLLDQFEWGYRVAQLGLGPAPLRRRALNLKSLSTAVQLMLHDAAMRARAAEVGVALRADDGVGRGVDELERFVAAWHATAPLARCIWSPSRPIVAKRPKPRGLPDALALPPLPPRPTLWPLVLAALLLLAALLAAAYSTAANVALALK
jgi:sterol 3beta-glucosyltransferase